MSEHIHCASCGASELGCRDGGCCDDCGHEGFPPESVITGYTPALRIARLINGSAP